MDDKNSLDGVCLAAEVVGILSAEPHQSYGDVHDSRPGGGEGGAHCCLIGVNVEAESAAP